MRRATRGVVVAMRADADPPAAPDPWTERAAAAAVGALVLVGALGTYAALRTAVGPPPDGTGAASVPVPVPAPATQMPLRPATQTPHRPTSLPT
jgi:hypothetical protein